MDMIEWAKVITNAPMSLLLLYLLLKSQKDLTEARAKWDAERAALYERLAGLTEKVVDAINELTFKA